MLNQAVLVGRIVKDPEIKDVDNDKKVCQITVAVNRPFKNAEGVYETDFIPCTLWNGIAENSAEYLKKGDMVGIKGRISIEKDKNDINRISIVAERVTFLSQAKEHKEKSDVER